MIQNDKGIPNMIIQDETGMGSKIGKSMISVVLTLICLVLTVHILLMVFSGSSFGGHGILKGSVGYNLLDRFDNYITNLTSKALDGIIEVE